MDRTFSVYLDLVRFSAACMVYLYHSNQRWLVKDILPLSNYGHASVIVFFVLSGFVISYISSTRETSWPLYTASRLARVFSVVVPTLALCLLLDSIGRQLAPDVYSGYPFDRFGQRLLGSLLMLNEIWFISITSFSNVPYWSITFEFWYYVLFGLVMFLPKPYRLAVAVALLLILGLKIALLAPVWLAGVLLHRWQRLANMSQSTGWLLAIGSAALIVLLFIFGVFDRIHAATKAMMGDAPFEQLTFARFFVGDYLLGALVLLHFAGMRRIAPSLAGAFLKVEKPIRWLASYTFTLYLLHQPLFLFWGALLGGDPSTTRAWVTVSVLVAATVLLVGYFTENQRGPLKIWILHGLERARQAFHARARLAQ